MTTPLSLTQCSLRSRFTFGSNNNSMCKRFFSRLGQKSKAKARTQFAKQNGNCKANFDIRFQWSFFLKRKKNLLIGIIWKK